MKAGRDEIILMLGVSAYQWCLPTKFFFYKELLILVRTCGASHSAGCQGSRAFLLASAQWLVLMGQWWLVAHPQCVCGGILEQVWVTEMRKYGSLWRL